MLSLFVFINVKLEAKHTCEITLSLESSTRGGGLPTSLILS